MNGKGNLKIGNTISMVGVTWKVNNEGRLQIKDIKVGVWVMVKGNKGD